ncbi:MAG: hypothetical protein LIO81_02385 [Clostridiales bacterium]|nr:hypothetical protein [Clostridiales bacterium]
MDYEWKWYMHDLKAGKIQPLTVTGEERAGVRYLKERLAAPVRKQIRYTIRNMLAGYREQDAAGRALIEDVMKQHGEYCKAANDRTKRRHNSVVCRYMLKTPMNDKSVAFRFSISERMLRNDINSVIDELSVILIGVPALTDAPESWPEAVRSIFENMRLLEYGPKVCHGFQLPELEQERARGQEITACSLKSIEKAVLMYEAFFRYGLTSAEIEERRLKAIKERCLDMDRLIKSTQDVANDNDISDRTVFYDIEKAVRRFAELMEYMAIAGAEPGGQG